MILLIQFCLIRPCFLLFYPGFIFVSPGWYFIVTCWFVHLYWWNCVGELCTLKQLISLLTKPAMWNKEHVCFDRFWKTDKEKYCMSPPKTTPQEWKLLLSYLMHLFQVTQRYSHSRWRFEKKKRMSIIYCNLWSSILALDICYEMLLGPCLPLTNIPSLSREVFFGISFSKLQHQHICVCCFYILTSIPTPQEEDLLLDPRKRLFYIVSLTIQNATSPVVLV